LANLEGSDENRELDICRTRQLIRHSIKIVNEGCHLSRRKDKAKLHCLQLL